MRPSVPTLVSLACLFSAAATPGQELPAGFEYAVPDRQPRGDRPNVILILTDDQGCGDLGFAGNPVIRTPNLDAMARRSARLTNFYVSPVCAPTRASLMTGRYNYRTRVVDTYIGRAMMEPDEITVAEYLAAARYATGIFGKWHLGDNYPMRPIDQGFEEALVHRGGGIGQPSDPIGAEARYTDAVLFHNGERTETEGYCTTVYFDAAMQWMERQAESDRPFFTYLALNCPHGPFGDVPADEYAAYEGVDLSNGRFPRDQGHPLPEGADLDRRARIFAMISDIDTEVGRLFAFLDRLEITDNTLVIFAVDNGPNGRRFVGGRRGMKGEVYEGGVHSPFFAHWPARLKPGHTSDRVAAHIDVLPTILDACGMARPVSPQLDGRSLLPLLEGRDATWPDRTIFIQAHRGDVPVAFHNFMARSQRWKLLRASGFGREQPAFEPSELYDMERDPLEEHDVAAQHRDVVAAMQAEYTAWFKDVSETRPDNYAPPLIHVGTERENPVVLTRQDWRRLSHDHGWQHDSQGYWALHAETAGPYDITVRWQDNHRPERIELSIGNLEESARVGATDTDLVFHRMLLPEGPAALQATLTAGDEKCGPYQVEVRWHDERLLVRIVCTTWGKPIPRPERPESHTLEGHEVHWEIRGVKLTTIEGLIAELKRLRDAQNGQPRDLIIEPQAKTTSGDVANTLDAVHQAGFKSENISFGGRLGGKKKAPK